MVQRFKIPRRLERPVEQTFRRLADYLIDRIAELQASIDAIEVGAGGDVATHIADTTDAHDASAISYAGASGIASTDVEGAIDEVNSDVLAHLGDTVDAHDASAISYAGATGISATEVEGALDEINGDQIATAAVAAAALPKAGGDVTGTVTFNATGGKLIMPYDGDQSGEGITYLDASGNPMFRLHSVGGGSMYFKMISGSAISGITFADTAGRNAMRILDGGATGMGTASPAGVFHCLPLSAGARGFVVESKSGQSQPTFIVGDSSQVSKITMLESAFNLYNLNSGYFSEATNYEKLVLSPVSNVYRFNSVKGGTGTVRGMEWAMGGTVMMGLSSAGVLTMNAQQIKNVADPTSGQDVATRAWVLGQALIPNDGANPAQVGSVAATPGVQSVFVKWAQNTESDMIGGFGTYVVEIDTDSGFSAPFVSKEVGSAFVAFTGLAAGVQYHVRVKAKDAWGNLSSSWSTTASTTTLYVTNSDIAVGTINANVLVANSITAAEIAAGTITTTQIAAGTIVASDIQAATITGSLIAAGTIQAVNIAAGTITSTEIAADTITSGNIQAGTIVASDIATGTITSNEIAAGTITAADIAANTITADEIDVLELDVGQYIKGAGFDGGGSQDLAATAGWMLDEFGLQAYNAILRGSLRTYDVAGAYVEVDGNSVEFFPSDIDPSEEPASITALDDYQLSIKASDSAVVQPEIILAGESSTTFGGSAVHVKAKRHRLGVDSGGAPGHITHPGTVGLILDSTGLGQTIGSAGSYSTLNLTSGAVLYNDGSIDTTDDYWEAPSYWFDDAQTGVFVTVHSTLLIGNGGSTAIKGARFQIYSISGGTSVRVVVFGGASFAGSEDGRFSGSTVFRLAGPNQAIRLQGFQNTGGTRDAEYTLCITYNGFY